MQDELELKPFSNVETRRARVSFWDTLANALASCARRQNDVPNVQRLATSSAPQWKKTKSIGNFFWILSPFFLLVRRTGVASCCQGAGANVYLAQPFRCSARVRSLCGVAHGSRNFFVNFSVSVRSGCGLVLILIACQGWRPKFVIRFFWQPGF